MIPTPIYRSQWERGAQARRNDCGPACVAMFLGALGNFTAIDRLRTRDKSGLTTAEDLRGLLLDHGVLSHIEHPASLDEVTPYAILLVRYAPLRPYVQDKGFAGLHWLIYLGRDGLHAFAHDPNYWGSRITEGDHKRYPYSVLGLAFRSVGSVLYAVVPDGMIRDEIASMIKVKVQVNNRPGVNMRMQPAGSLLRELKNGTRLTAYDVTERRTLSGTSYLWQFVETEDGLYGWVASKYLKAAS